MIKLKLLALGLILSTSSFAVTKVSNDLKITKKQEIKQTVKPENVYGCATFDVKVTCRESMGTITICNSPNLQTTISEYLKAKSDLEFAACPPTEWLDFWEV